MFTEVCSGPSIDMVVYVSPRPRYIDVNRSVVKLFQLPTRFYATATGDKMQLPCHRRPIAALWLYVAVVTVYDTDTAIAFSFSDYSPSGDGRSGICSRRFAVMMTITLDCFVGDNNDGPCMIGRLTRLLFSQLQCTAW